MPRATHERTMPQREVRHTVFITGCATGFGHRLAARLLGLGHRVIATDAGVEAWPERLGAPRDDLLVLACDVRDDDAVATAAEKAMSWGTVDVLVNNAGYAIFGTQEETRLDLVAQMFEVNVLGAARVTRALLPALRENRGQVIQLSSVAGRTVFPESGFYAATKYALEAISEALFQECCTFGLRVRLIEPGSFDTQFLPTAARLSPRPVPTSPYNDLRHEWNTRKRAILEDPQDPKLVVDAIVGALDDPAPFCRIPVGPDSERILALRDALGPDNWSRFAGARAGLDVRGVPGDMPSASELLDLTNRGEPVPEAVLTAYRLGHLEHWADAPGGGEALARVQLAVTRPS